jgi:hypothetical protein
MKHAFIAFGIAFLGFASAFAWGFWRSMNSTSLPLSPLLILALGCAIAVSSFWWPL